MLVRCLQKNRDAKGTLINYTLQDETGKVFLATGQQIKVEINKGQFKFTNLQIDKAGRLVDKAEEKEQKPAEKKIVEKKANTEKYYTEVELIKRVNPKGYKVKAYDPKTGKEYIGVGTSVWGKGNEGLHNAINVYIKELGVLAVVSIDGDKGIWADYSNRFPYPFKYRVDTAVADKYYESIGDKIVDFYDSNKKKYNLRMYIGSTYKVDAKPNPNGEYTILAIGKTNDRDYYKVRNNLKGTEYWALRQDVWANVHNNNYTNIAVKCDKMVFARNIPVVDITEMVSKINKIEHIIENWFEKGLKTGVLRLSDNQYSMNDQNRFDWVCNSLKEKLDECKTDYDFGQLMFDVFDSIVSKEEPDEKGMIYYGYIGDDSGYSDADAMFSYDKKVVEKYLADAVDDFACCLEGSKMDAIIEATQYQHTNIFDEQ